MVLPFKSELKNQTKTGHSIDETTGETIDGTTGETIEGNPIKSQIAEIGNAKVVEILTSHLELNAIDAANQRTADLGQTIGAEMTDAAVTGEEITNKEGIIIAMTTVVVTIGVATIDREEITSVETDVTTIGVMIIGIGEMTIVVTIGVAIGIETTGKEIPRQSALETGIAQVVGNLILQIEQNVSVVENQKE